MKIFIISSITIMLLIVGFVLGYYLAIDIFSLKCFQT